MTEQVWWYATRAAGLMTWSTAVASILLGLLLSTRILGKKPSGPWLLDVHRFLGGLSLVFLVVHLGAIWADSFVDFGPRELLVPGASDWNPSADLWGISAVTWGIGSAYALVAVQLTSLLRNHIRPVLWRVVHYLSIITVGAGSIHAYRAGTDVDNPVVVATAVGSSLLVVMLTIVRMRRATGEKSESAQAEILAEMRQRLDAMPMPEQTAQPQLDLSHTWALPRRSPVRDADEPAAAPRSMFDRFEPLGIGPEASVADPPGPGSDEVPTPVGPEPAIATGHDVEPPALGDLEHHDVEPPALGDLEAVEVESSAPVADVDPPATGDGHNTLLTGLAGPLEAVVPPIDSGSGDTRSFLAETGAPSDGEPEPTVAEGGLLEQLPGANGSADHQPEASPFAGHDLASLPSSGPASEPVDDDLVAEHHVDVHHRGQPVAEAEIEATLPPPPPPPVEQPAPQSTAEAFPPPRPAPEEPPTPQPTAQAFPPPTPAPEEPPAPQPTAQAFPPPPVPVEPQAPQPTADDTYASASADLEAWETALESLLGEALPRLPRFDPPDIPPVTSADRVSAPDETPGHPAGPVAAVDPPAETPVSPGQGDEFRPAVQAVDLSDQPQGTAPSSPPEPARPASGPPPLPVNAVDPSSGETNEDAYRDWLKEWLAYAEQYGDEAPTDPTRVDS